MRHSFISTSETLQEIFISHSPTLSFIYSPANLYLGLKLSLLEHTSSLLVVPVFVLGTQVLELCLDLRISHNSPVR